MSHYSVHPRYTPGSGAMVSRAQAERVAAQERDAHARALTGVYGAAERERAERLGLAGIAELLAEEGGAWLVRDLCTGEMTRRPFSGAPTSTPVRAPRAKRASYRDAVDWIAQNDGSGDPDALDPEAAAALTTATLIADIFGVPRDKVGADIVRRRKKLEE